MENKQSQASDATCLWFSQHPSDFLTSQRMEHQVVFVQHDIVGENHDAQSDQQKKQKRSITKQNQD